PREDDQALLTMAEQHPKVQEQSMLMEQSRALKSRAEADRYPNVMLGLDYIETGERTDATPEDNGKDAVLATISVELPIWFDAYAAAERGAESLQRSRAAQRIAMKDEVQAQILDAMAMLRDSHRRVGLFRDTLIPQAETTYAAVLGDYETGQATIATMLLAYRDLLELRLGLIRAQADHAKAWVWLESVVGRPVQVRSATP
ncbi:MAG: TolC family protein, partial [Myxococcota bacterium]